MNQKLMNTGLSIIVASTLCGCGGREQTCANLNEHFKQEYQQGRFSSALTQAQAEVKAAEKEFGHDSVETAKALNHVALAMQALDRNADSIPVCKEAVRIAIEQCGKQSEQAGSYMNTLATAYLAQKELEAALTTINKAIAALQASAGPESIKTAGAFNLKGLILNEMDRRKESVKCFEKAAGVFREQLGPDHPTTRGILENLDRTR